MHGQQRGNVLQKGPYSVEGNGEWSHAWSSNTGLTPCSYSVLPALTLDGIIAVDLVEGSYNTNRFKKFIDGLLDQMNPFPGPCSVIVLDNCRIHKSNDVADMIYDR
jgi:hypothetical protein